MSNPTPSFPPVDDLIAQMRKVDWSTRAQNGVRYVLITIALMHTFSLMIRAWWVSNGREQSAQLVQNLIAFLDIICAESIELYEDIYTALIAFDIIIDTEFNLDYAKWRVGDLRILTNSPSSVRKAQLVQMANQ